MGESLEVEHQRRLRAERVQAALTQVWGDDFPPGPNAALTVLVDAVGIDDFHSTEDRFVSQGDGVSYQVLAALWQHYRSWSPTDQAFVPPGMRLQLPQVLTERLQALQLLPDPATVAAAAGSFPSRTAAAGSVGEVAPRTGPAAVVAQVGGSTDVGVWEIDPQTDFVAFDAVTAQLLGAGKVAGYSTVTRHLQELVHPDDRAKVTSALQEAVATETAYRVRFRGRSAAGVITHLISHGQVLRKPSDPSARLTGYLTIDRDGERAAEVEAGSSQPTVIDLS